MTQWGQWSSRHPLCELKKLCWSHVSWVACVQPLKCWQLTVSIPGANTIAIVERCWLLCLEEDSRKKSTDRPWLNISTMSLLVRYSASLHNKNRAQEIMRWSIFFFILSAKINIRSFPRCVLLLQQCDIMKWEGLLRNSGKSTVAGIKQSSRRQRWGYSPALWPSWLNRSEKSPLCLWKWLIKLRRAF